MQAAFRSFSGAWFAFGADRASPPDRAATAATLSADVFTKNRRLSMNWFIVSSFRLRVARTPQRIDRPHGLYRDDIQAIPDEAYEGLKQFAMPREMSIHLQRRR